jgi:hypothetical protein
MIGRAISERSRRTDRRAAAIEATRRALGARVPAAGGRRHRPDPLASAQLIAQPAARRPACCAAARGSFAWMLCGSAHAPTRGWVHAPTRKTSRVRYLVARQMES